MENNQRTFEEVTSQATICLKDRLLRAQGTLHHYNCLWSRIKEYMKLHDIKFIDATVCNNYLLQEFNHRDYNTLTKREKDCVKTFTALIEFIETGSIQPPKEVTDFNGSIGSIMIDYLTVKSSLRLAKHTIDEYEQHLYRFLRFLNENRVISIDSVNQLHIINYIRQINPQTKSLSHIAIRVLKDLFKYLYTQNVLDKDFSCLMPKDNYKAQAKIPSSYSLEEVEKLIATIDRGCATGKRDYSIILLAARLGLRASDIANLKFENILWEQNSIHLTQFKTGTKIELPLLAEIGNSLIDYLKYSRPKSEEPFVFLCARSPFNSINTSVITRIVQNTFVKTGINTKNRRHGPHALRHSLAGRLLEKQTTLPVISEVLGHENTESTRFYLRIDLTSLRRCVLEVPAVPQDFYSQKGGYFYE
jgi:site-specific recombinase XerD